MWLTSIHLFNKCVTNKILRQISIIVRRMNCSRAYVTYIWNFRRMVTWTKTRLPRITNKVAAVRGTENFAGWRYPSHLDSEECYVKSYGWAEGVQASKLPVTCPYTEKQDKIRGNQNNQNLSFISLYTGVIS